MEGDTYSYYYRKFPEGKGAVKTSTNTFDRRLEIREPDSIRKIMEIVEKEMPKKTLSDHPYTGAERERIVTSKRVATKRILSDETRKRKEFFASHRVAINIDPVTKEPMIEVTERR